MIKCWPVADRILLLAMSGIWDFVPESDRRNWLDEIESSASPNVFNDDVPRPDKVHVVAAILQIRPAAAVRRWHRRRKRLERLPIAIALRRERLND